MKLYVVYKEDRFDGTKYGSKYFLNRETAMTYYENGLKDENSYGFWDWDEIETED
jgi:hypothetical protein